MTNHAAQLAIIKHVTRQESRSSAGNCQADGVTVSVGVAAAAPATLETVRDLLEAADAALYAAKRRGRNAVVEHGFVRSYDRAVSLSA